MSQFELIDETGASRFRGSQRPPGGGSQPLTKTLTAAEIADGWDGGAFYSTVEWPEFDADTFALIAAEIATTLDGDLTFDSIYAYDPGATTADVLNNGEAMLASQAGIPRTYQAGYIGKTLVNADTIEVRRLLAGKAAYIVYVGGSTPPTTGAATIRALRLS